jgi:hypothetical protein
MLSVASHFVGDGQEPASARRCAPNVVDEDVDPVASRGDQAGRPGRRAEVGFDHLDAAIGSELVEFGGGFARAGCDVCAARHERAGDGQADAPARAGDDGAVAGEIDVHRVSPFGVPCFIAPVATGNTCLAEGMLCRGGDEFSAARRS